MLAFLGISRAATESINKVLVSNWFMAAFLMLVRHLYKSNFSNRSYLYISKARAKFLWPENAKFTSVMPYFRVCIEVSTKVCFFLISR